MAEIELTSGEIDWISPLKITCHMGMGMECEYTCMGIECKHSMGIECKHSMGNRMKCSIK